MNRSAIGLTNIMSKMMNIGIPFDEIIRMTTVNPAQEVRRPDLGNLSPGSCADVAVLKIIKGDFGFTDISRVRMSGKEKIICEVTIREGRVVWDIDGLASLKEYVMPTSSLYNANVQYQPVNKYQSVQSVNADPRTR